MLIDDILSIIKKVIPDKNKQDELEVELRKLDIQHLKEKGEYIEKINKLIPMVLPCFLLVLLGMFTLNYLSDFVFSILGKEAPIIHIDDRLVEFCKWFVAFLFSKKTLEKFSNK